MAASPRQTVRASCGTGPQGQGLERPGAGECDAGQLPGWGQHQEGAVRWIDEMTLGGWAYGEHIRWNVSEDAGATFRPYEQYITDITGGWDHMTGHWPGWSHAGHRRGPRGRSRDGGVELADQPTVQRHRCGSSGRTAASPGPIRCGSTTSSGQAPILHLDGGDPITDTHIVFYDRRLSARTATHVYVATSERRRTLHEPARE